jgi:heptosyltransferase III
VVLTLPMAGLIKKDYPDCKIYFLGRSYTKDIIGLSEFVDEFINYDEIEKLEPKTQIQLLRNYQVDIFIHVFPNAKIANLVKAAGIPLRVGTTNRLFHWMSCNKLIKLSRKNSPLHEAQLNLKLLSFLNINVEVDINNLHTYYGFKNIPTLREEYQNWLDKNKFNLILHPKSKGSAKEWGLSNFEKLIKLLPQEKYKLFISGTEQDGKLMQEFLSKQPNVTDLTGKLSLNQFIAFINASNGLVAASTGPLHVAAALNKVAIGLFSPKRPIHPGRWKPLGEKAYALVKDENCEKCKQKKNCDCITQISPEEILAILKQHEGI